MEHQREEKSEIEYYRVFSIEKILIAQLDGYGIHVVLAM